RSRSILCLNASACKNRNAHYSEIIRTNVILHGNAITRATGLKAGDENGISRFTVREQSIGGIGDRAYSRSSRQTGIELLRDKLHFFAVVTGASRVEPGDN